MSLIGSTLISSVALNMSCKTSSTSSRPAAVTLPSVGQDCSVYCDDVAAEQFNLPLSSQLESFGCAAVWDFALHVQLLVRCLIMCRLKWACVSLLVCNELSCNKPHSECWKGAELVQA